MSQHTIDNTAEHDDIDKWNARLTEAIVELSRPLVRYFRAEVMGLDNIRLDHH